MCSGIRTELEAGALGVGLPIGYFPGATRGEVFELYKCAAEMDSVIFTHVRGINIGAIKEAIADAVVNGTSLHIVHINSVSLGEIDTSLAMVKAAQVRGLDITTELYPYTAASTSLESSLFDEGWQQRMGISYGDLQWQDTGERLTEETFKKYREQGGVVIIHLMKPEWIEKGIKAPFTMIASDGMPYAPGAHPRSAGTFSRVLGRYVREQKALSLKEALAKMTIMPAKRLEKVATAAKLKGRIQVGADADITIFDPDTIIDTATFEKDLSFSTGVKHVIVNGTFVVKDGTSVENVFPGRPLLGKYRR
ncbi:MAG: amidohydrolase family protein [Aridibacter famidurans]|nr:amidohydrolase family protein [Aridibacter famidurans]